MTEEKKQTRHIAWDDRAGLTKIWHDLIEQCNAAFGTEYYRSRVQLLIENIVNVKKGPSLYDKILHYKETTWREEVNRELHDWARHNSFDADTPDIYQQIRENIEEEHLPKLQHYVIQLLEDTNFGTYETDEDQHEQME